MYSRESQSGTASCPVALLLHLDTIRHGDLDGGRVEIAYPGRAEQQERPQRKHGQCEAPQRSEGFFRHGIMQCCTKSRRSREPRRRLDLQKSGAGLPELRFTPEVFCRDRPELGTDDCGWNPRRGAKPVVPIFIGLAT